MMGVLQSQTKESESGSSGSKKPVRVLCLHGWRTSGEIMARQMKKLVQTINMEGDDVEFLFPDAPFEAKGAPQELVEVFFPGLPYFEWTTVDSKDNFNTLKEQEIETSLAAIESIMAENPVDVIVGFSQGCAMITRLLAALPATGSHHDNDNVKSPKRVLLLSGVCPREVEARMKAAGFERDSEGNVIIPPQVQIQIPSMHVHGNKDELLPSSKRLLDLYNPDKRVVLLSMEGHNVPSPATGLYKEIREFILGGADTV